MESGGVSNCSAGLSAADSLTGATLATGDRDGTATLTHMDADRIAAQLRRPGAPWTRLLVPATTPSTSADVAAAARDGAPEGLVVATEHQSAGRGRLDRRWEAASGSGLAVSVLLRPGAVPAARWPWLPLLTGVAVQAALRAVTGVEARLKWPNDVLVGEKKVAGILLERVDGLAGPAAVVGIGVNVSMTAQQLPVPHATSLLLEDAIELDPERVLVGLLLHLGEAYATWRDAAGDPQPWLRHAYTDACSSIGIRVRAELPGGGEVTGQATGIDELGRLVVASADGRMVVGAGEVVHLRTGS
ncbi:MAG: biotin--[acetyl-CoA-carboxylase] ligase [Nocardioidaceae bacterium]|nr:biotin--[acetyl-CoA-carboxylase] ligase [Nocardioidaceae bacterium]